MASPRDLFVNVDRVRRVYEPPVDVFYVGDPPRAVVQAELPAIDPGEVTLEVRGRELLLAGRRAAPDAGGRLYQQLEMEHGAFRRVIALGADVVADEAAAHYRDGILEITLPIRRDEPTSRRVPIREPGRS